MIRTSHESKRGCGYRKGGGLYLVAEGGGRACGKLALEIVPCEQCADMGVTCRLEQSRGWTDVDLDKLFSTVECDSTDYLGDAVRALEHCSGCPLAGGLGKGGLLWVGEQFYPTVEKFTDEARRMGISKRLPLTQVPRGLVVGKTWVLLAHPRAVDKGACTRCARGSEYPVIPGDLFHVPKQGAVVRKVVKRLEGSGIEFTDGTWVGPEERVRSAGDYLASANELKGRRERKPGAVWSEKRNRWKRCQDCDGQGKLYAPGVFRIFQPQALEYVVKGDETPEDLKRLEDRGIELVMVIPVKGEALAT